MSTPALSSVATGDVIQASDINKFVSPIQNLEGGLTYYVALTGSGNAYVATPSPAWNAYAAGNILVVKPNVTNTGAATVNVSSLGAKPIKKLDGTTDVRGGDLIAGNIYILIYDGTSFLLIDTRGGSSIFGDGSDGDVTIASNTSLNRNMYYDNLTINDNVTLNPNGYVIFCRGVCNLAGVNSRISGNGNNAAGATGGAGLASSVLGGSGGGGNGGPGNGAPGTSQTSSLGGAGGAGGNSGANTGGGGGNATPPTENNGGVRVVKSVGATPIGRDFSNALLTGGAGGGSGAGDGTNAGGGGGGGGRPVYVLARAIIGSGSIESKGGNGGNGAAGNAAGGGGGGGGYIVLVTLTPTTITTSVAGGLGGSPSGTGTAGANGSPGRVVQIVNG